MFLVLIVVFSVWSVFRAGTRVTAFRREIVVNVPREIAWEHFSRPMQWRSWLGDTGAPTAVTPSDVVGPDTVAKFGDSFGFRMTQFAPPDHWMWSAKAGWLLRSVTPMSCTSSARPKSKACRPLRWNSFQAAR